MLYKVLLESGDSILVTKMGDEAFHFLQAEDGTPVVEVREGVFRLAPDMKESIPNLWAKRSKKRNAHRISRGKKLAAMNARRRTIGKESMLSGDKRGIVILVEFADKAMHSTEAHEIFNDIFNKHGYDKNGHIGSVKDYFHQCSYGQLNLEFDVYGPYKLSSDTKFYGENNQFGDDIRAADMVEEACKIADQSEHINWKQYDWDGDGEVDQVFVIYAGLGENVSSNSNLIWPHEWSLREESEFSEIEPFLLGGVLINTYAVSNELCNPFTITGIGTACHEFSHCFGLPDFYDTSYNGGFGMNAWDLLDSGSYNGPYGWGEVPCAYTAYERWFCGWLTPTELHEPCRVEDMPDLQDSACAYIIYNDNNRNEYFLIENRQSKGWFKYVDTYTKCHGMLAYHVDYDEEAWAENCVNFDANHQRMSIIPAGKSFGTYYTTYGMYNILSTTYASQLFPGTKGVTTLDNTSHAGETSSYPYTSFNGTLFNCNTDGSFYMNKPITDIEEKNGKISFNFMGYKESENTVIESVEKENSTDAPSDYYTISGIKVLRPTYPGTYIEVRGGKALRKLIVR